MGIDPFQRTSPRLGMRELSTSSAPNPTPPTGEARAPGSFLNNREHNILASGLGGLRGLGGLGGAGFRVGDREVAEKWDLGGSQAPGGFSDL